MSEEETRWKLRILHMRDHLRRVLDYTQGMDQRQLSRDLKTADAVARCFQVIGEAAKKVPEDVRALYPSVPWREAAALRNILVHEYDGVDYELLYKIITERVPAFEAAISKIPVSEEDL